jgi:hypothetical protein
MNEKNYDNQFKFSLYQEDIVLGERIFSADNFNPFTRYSIDIRDLLPHIITRLQKVLSKRSYDVELDCGDNKNYNFYKHTQNLINSYPKRWQRGMRYNPEVKKHEFEDKTIRGVECKIGLYINDNPIVERVFYVDGFNPVARYSVDVLYTVINIADEIFINIKDADIRNMWDDYDLINKKGLSINQIRELPVHRRESLLRSLN